MFTGLVECSGRLARAEAHESDQRLNIQADFSEPLVHGESIAVSGICLSVEAFGAGFFEVTAIAETLKRTTLGSARPGDSVNLERALRLSDRLGGHLVTGHIDCVGRLVSQTEDELGRYQVFEFPVEYDPFVVEKGSIAVDGVSLTVVSAQRGLFSVALIPLTCQMTTLGRLKAGDRANLEFDLIGKYVWRQSVGVRTPENREEKVRA